MRLKALLGHATTFLLIASLPASADIRECVGPNGETSFTNLECPPGHTLKGATPETPVSRPRGMTSPESVRTSTVRDIPADVLDQIRSNVESKFPGNTSTEFLIRKDVEAYVFLQGYSPVGIPSQEWHTIRDYYAALYPHDYSIRKNAILGQIEQHPKWDDEERSQLLRNMEEYLSSR